VITPTGENHERAKRFYGGGERHAKRVREISGDLCPGRSSVTSTQAGIEVGSDHRGDGDGLSEFEQADAGHRWESEESEPGDSLKQEEARGEEKSEKESGEKVEKGEEGVSNGKRARIPLN
jgi:hypothetical protein